MKPNQPGCLTVAGVVLLLIMWGCKTEVKPESSVTVIDSLYIHYYNIDSFSKRAYYLAGQFQQATGKTKKLLGDTLDMLSDSIKVIEAKFNYRESVLRRDKDAQWKRDMSKQLEDCYKEHVNHSAKDVWFYFIVLIVGAAVGALAVSITIQSKKI